MNHPPNPVPGTAIRTRPPGDLASGGTAAITDAVLSLSCPNCRHPLNLNRGHLGIEGHCVSCKVPLVAVERPGSGIVLESPAPTAADSPGSSGMPTLPAPESPPEIQPTTGTDSPNPSFAAPMPTESPVESDPSNVVAAMAGFTGSSARRRQTGGGPSGTPSAAEAVEDFPPQQPPAFDSAKARSPFAAHPHSDAPANPGPAAISTPPDSPEAEPEQSNPAARTLSSGFAALLKKSGLGKGSESEPAPPDREPDPDPEDPAASVSPESKKTPLPWETEPAAGGPSSDPDENNQASPSDRNASEVGLEKTSGKETETPKKSEKWAGSPDPVETHGGKGRKRKSKKSRSPASRSVPGAAIADPKTRRRMLRGPRRGFFRFLFKICVFFTLLAGTGVGIYLFTPEEKLESWKASVIDFLRPGAVLREYLPFDVPFLDRLAEEENQTSLPPGQPGVGTAPRSDILPSAEVSPGPMPRGMIPSSERDSNHFGRSLPPRDPTNGPKPRGMVPWSKGEPSTVERAENLERAGYAVLEKFYRSESIGERTRLLVDPERSRPAMDAFYRESSTLPALRSVAYRGPMRDTASGRWFGVFDVREIDDNAVHRWCVVRSPGGEPKIDWGLYEQLRSDSLAEFLNDPAAPPKSFRLLVRRGYDPPTETNPWKDPGAGLLVQTPLDTGLPKEILLRRSDFQRFGFDSRLHGNRSKIVRLELSWTDGESEPLRRVPTITKVMGWGAW